MSKLPVISGAECVKALEKIGFTIRRQKSSHIIMRRDNPYTLIVVPAHKTLKAGTLRKIICDIGLTVDEFIDIMD